MKAIQEAGELNASIERYLSGEMTAMEAAHLERDLATDPRLSEALQQQLMIRHLLECLPPAETPPGLCDRIEQALAREASQLGWDGNGQGEVVTSGGLFRPISRAATWLKRLTGSEERDQGTGEEVHSRLPSAAYFQPMGWALRGPSMAMAGGMSGIQFMRMREANPFRFAPNPLGRQSGKVQEGMEVSKAPPKSKKGAWWKRGTFRSLFRESR